MNTEISDSSVCYGLYDAETIIGFMAVLHQPNARNKMIKRVSRLVILPDYQGIGLGTAFLNFVARFYKEQSYDFSIITSAKNMIMSLRKSKLWAMTQHSVVKPSPQKNALDYNRGSLRNNVKTASFFFIG